MNAIEKNSTKTRAKINLPLGKMQNLQLTKISGNFFATSKSRDKTPINGIGEKHFNIVLNQNANNTIR